MNWQTYPQHHWRTGTNFARLFLFFFLFCFFLNSANICEARICTKYLTWHISFFHFQTLAVRTKNTKKYKKKKNPQHTANHVRVFSPSFSLSLSLCVLNHFLNCSTRPVHFSSTIHTEGGCETCSVIHFCIFRSHPPPVSPSLFFLLLHQRKPHHEWSSLFVISVELDHTQRKRDYCEVHGCLL